MKKWIPILAASVIFAACAKKEAQTSSSETAAAPATDTSAVSAAAGSTTTTTAAETIYTMYGVIVSRDAAKNTVNIDNEDVPGKMAAMKMDYEVRDAKVDALPPDGTKVQMIVHDQNGTYWLTEVKPRQ